MFEFPDTVILRHRRENLKKCSLVGLEKREDLRFLTYPRDCLPILENYLLLTIDAPELSSADKHSGLLLIDGTWKLTEKIVRQISQKNQLVFRSIPSHFRTAYPRKQPDCPSPEQGLASVEALFIAYLVIGRDTQGLLEHYHWKNQFLEKNLLYL